MAIFVREIGWPFVGPNRIMGFEVEGGPGGEVLVDGCEG